MDASIPSPAAADTPPQHELSEEDLESVVGGLVRAWDITPPDAGTARPTSTE